LIVLKTRLGHPVAYPQAPGTVVHGTAGGLHVVAGDARTVTIEQVQLEGKRPMSIADFLAGHQVREGTILGAA